MPRSSIKNTPTTAPIRATIHPDQRAHVEDVARRYGLDASQALRLIIEQHAAWEQHVKPVGVPDCEKAETSA